MEKFKKIKGGGTRKYIYYGCTRSRDKNCRVLYIREEKLIEQLLKIIDKLTLDELGVKEKLRAEIERHGKFQNILGSGECQINQEKININVKNYVKYLLKEGTNFEKREILACLKSRLTLANKELKLVK